MADTATKNRNAETLSEDGSESSPLASRESSNADLKSLSKEAPKKKLSLKDRSKIPNSFYLTLGIIATAHLCGGIWSISTLENWYNSMKEAGTATRDILAYLRDLTADAFQGKVDNWADFSKAFIFTFLVGSLMYVLFVAPFRAGFWTGPGSRKHKMHRYMGLSYLIQYFAAWIHYVTNYESARLSYLPHFIALNGMLLCSGSWNYFVGVRPHFVFSLFSRSDSGVLGILLLQGPPRAGGSWLLFWQGCRFPKLCPRKHLLQLVCCLRIYLLQWRVPS